MNIHKTGTPEINMSMISQFNVMNKCGQKVSKQGDVDYDKQLESANTHTRKIYEKNTYKFPLYIPKFHCFLYHSSPTLLVHIVPLLTLPQLQQHTSIHHHSLNLINLHFLHQQSTPLLRQMFYLHYI